MSASVSLISPSSLPILERDLKLQQFKHKTLIEKFLHLLSVDTILKSS